MRYKKLLKKLNTDEDICATFQTNTHILKLIKN